MRIIEGMRKIKELHDKLEDLQGKIRKNSAHYDLQPTEYGDNTRPTVDGWVQACLDINKEIIRLRSGITYTNLITPVSIEVSDGKLVTNSMYHWLLRAQTYAQLDVATIACLTDKGLKDQPVQIEGGIQIAKRVLNYDATARDIALSNFMQEKGRITGVLEIINATTDIVFPDLQPLTKDNAGDGRVV